ncbi:alpha-glutamyl/putrescinyl thymine pyrophosphorylase clade 3 protein [Glacieibacterium frigidum]|uniref:Alpha-glutamyl/putrescinyl thymine pyrophosphorylase clade 3 domain-containing protein n=1 Tax=Glacieibacterium frigidum TaxID=2593303 RepID=A0A552UA92_9SPHN|nr:hypothetical protein [Glacieibacterium frigidum]TRW15134.1 hypothetical protein FMM06_15945 [Glacieibacterium frigidum]
MWPSWDHERLRISDALRRHAAGARALPGIADARALEALSLQFVASLRRESYYNAVQRRPVAAFRADPNSPGFDPERAVAFHAQTGNVDEAAWLIFLMTHFARPADSGWKRLADVYGRLGHGTWDWASVSGSPAAFSAWLATNWEAVGGKFGNHRKYESLRPTANRNMARVVADYVGWIGQNGHGRFFADLVRRAGNDPRVIFDVLYREMPVISFGRLARFDYLMLLGRYGLVPIIPGSAYLDGATGPRSGVSLLFTGQHRSGVSIAALQAMLDELDKDLQVGMEVMEDALCNWQKSPLRFVHFKG